MTWLEMTWLDLTLVGGAAAIACWLATWPLLHALRRRQILDTPNQRSSHTRPTPRGGGLAVVAAALAAWLGGLALFGGLDTVTMSIAALAVVLAAVSFVDDLRGLPVALRLAVQAAAVALALLLLDGTTLVFQGLLPPIADRLVSALLWLWFINLFNFMDGIDGIAAVETASIGTGLAVIGAGQPGLAVPAAAIAGAAIGFVPWNWQPAKIFLGDVGSIALGFLLGWLLLALAAQGAWAAALLLPLYYLGDATITLARRLRRGEAVWQAHRSHFYQRAARALDSHARVSTMVLVCNVALIACAIGSVSDRGGPRTGLVVGIAVTLLLLWYFRSLQHERRHGN